MPGTAFTVAGNFVMSGTPSATAAAAMTVNGDFTIGNGCTFGAGSYTHNLGGNFANNGTFTASTSTMNFTGAASTAISGSSTTTFNDLTVNKGSNTASVLEATSVIAMASGGLTLTNGTLKLSSNSTITPFTADITSSPYLIPISAGLSVNGGTVSATSSMTCQGLLRVSTGTLNAGNAADEGITAASGFALTIDRGTVNVAGRLTRLSTSNPINFTMSSGTLTVGNVGNTSTAIAPFCIDQSGLSFSMSGGTIIVRNEGGTGANDLGYVNLAGTTNVTGGTLQIGDASTSAGQTMQINSSAPIWNLTINGANSPTAKLLTNALTVLNDLTLTSGTLNANSLNISVGGNWTNNASAGAFTPGTNTVTFTGAASKTISGSYSTTFDKIAVNKRSSSASVIEATAVIGMTAGGLTLTNGTLKISSSSTITPFTSDITSSPYLIPSTAGLWCNGGTINSPAGMTWSVAGVLRISAGTVNAGSAAGDSFSPQSGATIIVEGGNFNLADRISNNGISWNFSMTGGTLTVPTLGNTAADRPPFNMNTAGGSFSMSGSTIVIQRPGIRRTELGYYNTSTGGTGFTGGTLQIGNASTPASSTIQITTSRPVYNLVINGSNSPTAKLATYELTVTNDVTLTSGTLNANNLNMSVGGNWTNNVSVGAFTPGTGTTTFNGTGTQEIGGTYANTFYAATMTNAVGYGLGSDMTVTTALQLTSGTLTQDPTYNLTAGTLTIGANGTLRNYGTGSLTLGGAVSVAGKVDFNGGNDTSCSTGTRIQIRSTVNGTQRAWSSSGSPRFVMVDVDVKDQGGTAAIICYGSLSSGNVGANWTINTGCLAPRRRWR